MLLGDVLVAVVVGEVSVVLDPVGHGLFPDRRFLGDVPPVVEAVPGGGAAEVDLHGGLVLDRLPPLPHLRVLVADRPGWLFSDILVFLFLRARIWSLCWNSTDDLGTLLNISSLKR